MITHFVKRKPTSSLVDDEERQLTELLWGDPLHLEADWDSDPKWAYVRARGRPGWIRKSHIRQKSWTYNGLLEFYVIDVGQGDGVLCRTPDDRWHLIDAGRPNSHQMTKKGAANFLRWKFYRDLGMDRIKLHSLTASHSDFDHYGGMLDLLSGELYDGRTFDVEVAHFYHNGMGRFVGDDPLGKLKSGAIGPLPNDHYDIATHDHFIVDLLDDKDSFAAAGQSFSSSFGELAALVGSKCESAQRLSLADGHLPDYAPGESDVSVRILGPVVEQFGRQQGLRRLGSGREWESKTRNGHSLVFRFDYGNARILMTGDLNEESQRLLLSYTNADEFAVDVAKGCHHGSEDVNIGFIKAIKARATAISSGDNESYAHPRPVLLGASARYGRESKTPDGKVMAPLLYSTELARSVKLAYPTSVKLDPDFSGPQEERWFSAKKTKIKSSSTRYRKLDTTPIATDLVYGLVNVRTDGNTILCATMEESGGDFDTKLFKAGVDVEE